MLYDCKLGPTAKFHNCQLSQLVFIALGTRQKTRKMCKLALDRFCFVCGKYIFTKLIRNITESIGASYLAYFGFAIEHLDEDWTPKSICNTCNATLHKWATNPHIEVAMPFSIPALWRNQIDHVTDCYFCMTEVSIHGRHRKVNYPELRSVSKPVPHLPGDRIPKCPAMKSRKRESDVSAWSGASESIPPIEQDD